MRPSILASLSLSILVGCDFHSAHAQSPQVVVRNGIGFASYDYRTRKDDKVVPVLYFHGTSSSKLEPELVQDSIRDKGRWLIAFDRPGYGHSRAVHFNSLDDYVCWAEQKMLPALYEILGEIPEKMDFVGVSGGAMFALTLAQKRPDDVRRVSLLSCGLFARPVGREGNMEKARRLAANRPRLAEMVVKFSQRHLDFSQKMSAKKWSQADQEFAKARQEFAKRLFLDSTRCGAAGIVQDARLQLCDTSYAKPLDPRIQTEHWNGSCDFTVSVESAKLLSSKTGIELKIIEGEGHLSSLPIGFKEAVLSDSGKVHENSKKKQKDTGSTASLK